MIGQLRCDFKSKKACVLLVISFIAGMCIMHVFDTRQEYPIKTFAEVARYQQNSSSEEDYTSLQVEQLQKEHLTYGKVVHGKKRVILYNSAPKCGSRTFGATSKLLFRNRSLPMNIYTLRKDDRKRDLDELRSLVESIEAPAYCQGHGYFEPFDQRPRPVYINFVRDPVSRMVSAFYFRRYGDLSGLNSDRHWRNMSLEECVFGSCAFEKKNIYVGIFCGFDERCGSNLTWALDRAKSNIDMYYTFIGITEEYEASLRVLEHLMPDLYSGVTNAYLASLNDTSSMSTMSKTRNKGPLSQRANDTLTELFAFDYQLYNYIYDRHRALKSRFGIK